jgi:predicted Ser/Thr protein kinase
LAIIVTQSLHGMACPDGNRLQALIAGHASAQEREDILSHADSCADCRKVLAALAREAPTADPARASTIAADSPATESALLTKGMHVGRYEVESFLGAGGLSLVYIARDPELNRRVALKLLKSDAQARLLREAQAMARVSHPNVVAVHDVGEWNGRVFLAMELVDGIDLRAWLAAKPHRLVEIVDAFRDAGRGLAAAHAAGLVHRDFKPENVLVGKDGRVRVTDFGLAESLDAPAPTGDAISGTPAYMAPEQHRAENVDARTDQFAFCVALHEAAYGERPFRGKDYPQLRDAVLAGAVSPAPARPRVPRTLRRILLRGLSMRPGDRWPTMEGLLAALGRDRTKIPRRAGATAAALLAVLATAWIGDRIVRARLYAVARTSFADAGKQVERTLASRYESFSALANVSAMVPIMRQVAATRDQADFGLGAQADDHRGLEALHASLRDADWQAWSLVTRRGHLAVADYKGRLLFTTADSAAFGRDVRVIPAAAAAFSAETAGAQVLRSDDPRMAEAGLASQRHGLVILFAHASVLAGVSQAVFILTIDAPRLLEELRLDAQTHLALVAPDGAVEGDVPAAVVAKANGTLTEIDDWLVQRQPVPDLNGAGQPIAQLVLARPVDVGLAGLFPHARAILLFAAALAFAVLAWAAVRMITSS